MATNKEELEREIDALLAPTGEVSNLEEATRQRKRLSKALAERIDAYVQHQIGSRLEGILTALATQTSSGATTPLVRGPGFEALIRKEEQTRKI